MVFNIFCLIIKIYYFPGFISKEQCFLSDYTKDIDTLFINKICEGLLVRARDIMKKDLHDSILVEPEVINIFFNSMFGN